MAIILHIDSSVETASICLAQDYQILGFSINLELREHSSWLHLAIQRIFKEAALSMGKIDAVAVTIGPGSYTGLRVGLSAAKGICFSLGKPLIAVNTLQWMAASIDVETLGMDRDKPGLICPMIDARRMEVFTALYSFNREEKMAPTALVLDEMSFRDVLAQNQVLFIGNGVRKFRQIIAHSNTFFSEEMPDARTMTRITTDAFLKQRFSDLAYTEPFYIKEFFMAKP